MLGDLFDQGGVGGGPSTSSTPQRVAFEDGGGGSGPPRARGPSGLVGLENQGATCYLNSLIQVFVATPELRRAVLSVSAEQLGLIVVPDAADGAAAEDADAEIAAGNPRLRRIPYDLQRLLARLLLCDRESLSTRPLTRSFGWDRLQHADQHDVQELLRLLFSALEDSLAQSIGSPYEAIARQVAGAFRSSIRCRECGHASSRTEAFLDLCVTTVGFRRLEDSLDSLFGRETLEGDNRYRCDRCCKLVDAEKTSQLTKLPPVLTLSLMRFDFDFARMARVKHDGCFEFPAQLDLGRHLAEDCRDGDRSDSLYDLSAVVIHGGSAMGGHYHAYVLDHEGRGRWTDDPAPEAAAASSSLSASSPDVVLARLLKAAPGKRLRMGQLGTQFKAATGRAWAVACKDRWGSIEKFVRSNSHLFLLEEKDQWVQLKDGAEIQMETDELEAKAEAEIDLTKTEHPEEQSNRCPIDATEAHWFDLNDSRVTQIMAEDIKRQFAGRESAYMLFYRQRRLASGTFRLTPADIKEEMPDWLYRMVSRENRELRRRREAQDAEMHRVSYDLYHESQFKLPSDKLIWDLHGEDKPQGSVTCSCKKSIDLLLETIDEKMSKLMTEIGGIVCLERTDCGYYAVCKLPDAESIPGESQITSAPFMPNARDRNPFVFVCFSTRIADKFLCGAQHRPVKLTFHFDGGEPFKAVFPVSKLLIDSIEDAARKVPESIGKDMESAISARSCHVRREADGVRTTVPSGEFERSLAELAFKGGDELQVFASKLDEHEVFQHVEVTMIIDSNDRRTKTLRIRPGHKAGQVKQSMLDKVDKQAQSSMHPDSWRVEVYNEQLDCYCPEPDLAVVGDLRAPKLRLVREPPPGEGDAFVKVTRESPHGVFCLVAKLEDDVSQLRQLAACSLELDPSQYHLCFISPTGDPLSQLREGRSLSSTGVKHRSELRLAYGRPLLAGQFRLRVCERLPFNSSDWLARLSQSPESLLEPHGTLVVDTGARVGDLPGLLAREGLLNGEPPTRVALFRRKGRHQLTALHRPEATLGSQLAQKDVALCYDLLCGVAPAVGGGGGSRRGGGVVDPILLFVTSKESLAPDADYAAPSPLWWPVGDRVGGEGDADDSAASLYAAVSRLANRDTALRLAKRQHDRCDWLPIPLTKQGLYSQTSASAAAPLTGLTTTAPYLLRDGDVIAWTTTDEAGGGTDQFRCPQDERVLRQRRRAKELRAGGAATDDFDDVGGEGGGGRWWPAEKPLSISVPNYGPIN